jgi:hypothetical protein
VTVAGCPPIVIAGEAAKPVPKISRISPGTGVVPAGEISRSGRQHVIDPGGQQEFMAFWIRVSSG